MTACRSRKRPIISTLAALAALAALWTPATGRADPWQPWQGSTLAWQTVGGVGGAAVGSVAGGMVGLALVRSDGNSDGWADLGGLLLGMVAGGALGTGAGVWLAGDLDGGNGGLGWSMLGSTVGTIAGFATGASLSSDSGSAWMPFAGAILLGVGGGAVGYHLSATETAPGPMAGLLRVGSGGELLAGLPVVSPRVGLDGRSDGWQVALVAGRF